MNIPELKWIMNNRDIISKEDYTALNSFDIFNQYDNNKQLEQSATNMLELISLVGYIYEKYNGDKEKKKMRLEKFDICVDNDLFEIVEWINSHFKNGNYHKHFELTIMSHEVEFDEDGEKHYIFNPND